MNKNKKILTILLLFVMSMSGTAYATLKNARAEQPKHYLFLIHGIGGSRKHFGKTGEALVRILKKKDTTTEYLFTHVEYDTGNNEKTTYDFAQDLQEKIQKVIETEKLSSNDKISLIMHSQGGLVGSIWLFQSSKSKEGFGTPETLAYVDAFITLGTPFWGAKTAKWGSQVRKFIEGLKVELPLPYGKQELNDMSFGSDTIYDFRNILIDPTYQRDIDTFKNKIRFLNIAGAADLLNPLSAFVSGTEQYEDDGAVPLSSARFNFLYTQSLKEDYEEGDKVTLRNVKKVDVAPYYLVNAVHYSLLPDISEFEGLVPAPKACLKEEGCDHAVFNYLWKHILGQELQQSKKVVANLKTFLLDINVRLPKGLVLECDEVNVEVLNKEGNPLNKKAIEIKKFYEVYSDGMRKSIKYADHCRYYFMGSVNKNWENDEPAVLVRITGDKLKARDIEMKLKESYSSYVDINLVER